MIEGHCDIGIRIAAEEAPKFEFYTSRLGIGYKDIIPFYMRNVSKQRKFKLKLMHFFINTGITRQRLLLERAEQVRERVLRPEEALPHAGHAGHRRRPAHQEQPQLPVRHRTT